MSSPWAAPGSSSESTPTPHEITPGQRDQDPAAAPGASPWSASASSWGESATDHHADPAGTIPPAGGPAAPDGAAAARSRELSVRAPLFPLRPLSLGELLGAGTRIYRLRTRTVLGVTAVVLGVSYLLGTLLSGVSLTPFISSLGSFDANSPDVETGLTLDASSILPLVLGSLASGLVSLIATQLVAVAVTRLAISEASGTPVSTPEVWTALRRRALPAIAVGLIIAAAIALITIIPLALAGLVLYLTDGDVTSLIILGLVAVILIVAGDLWFWARTLLAVPALVTEGIGPIRALQRSFALTRGNRLWRVLGIGLLLNLLVYIATNILQGTLSLLTSIVYVGVLVATNGEHLGIAVTLMLVMSMLGAYICAVLTTPFLVSALAALYADARMRHEGWDVELGRAARAARPAQGTL